MVLDMIYEFEKFLSGNCCLSKSTLKSYLWTVDYFYKNYGEFSSSSLLAYKGYLVEHFKPQTVNLRLQAINRYLDFAGRADLKLRLVKLQNKTFIENVISDADYRYLKSQLMADGHADWAFVVWFLGATGARISELLQIKVEHVVDGHVDLYGKGGKLRRIYISSTLKREALEWLSAKGKSSGYIFTNRSGARLTPRGVAHQLKFFAVRYGINPEVVYPHSFRHLFAKNFLDRYNDISLLADLMGHESLETTRIYIRRTASEQRAVVDKVIDW